MDIEEDQLPQVRCPHKCNYRDGEGKLTPVIPEDITKMIDAARKDRKAGILAKDREPGVARLPSPVKWRDPKSLPNESSPKPPPAPEKIKTKKKTYKKK